MQADFLLVISGCREGIHLPLVVLNDQAFANDEVGYVKNALIPSCCRFV